MKDAILKGDLAGIKRLVAEGIDINSIDEGGALIYAAVHDQLNVFMLLLELNDIEVNVSDEDDFTALMWAAKNNHVNAVKKLLKFPDIEINSKDNHGSTALMYAANYGHSDVVRELLLHRDIDINALTNMGNTALTFAANNGHSSIVNMLLTFPNLADPRIITSIDVNLKGAISETALICAVRNNHLDIVKSLLKVPSIEVNTKNQHEINALMYAADGGCDDIVKELLLMPGIDINARSHNGNTALIYAAKNGHIAIVNMLLGFSRVNLSFESFLNANNHDGYSNIDINCIGNKGNTALIYAAVNLHVKVVKALLKSSHISVSLQNSKGGTAIMYASNADNIEMLSLLEDRMSHDEVALADKYGNSALNLSMGDLQKYLIYSGKVLVNDTFKSVAILNMLKITTRNEEDLCFIYRIKSMLLVCWFLSKCSVLFLLFSILQNWIILTIKIFVGNLSSLIPGIEFSPPVEKPFPHRIRLLASSVCGVRYSDSITSLHSGMSMPKFLWVSSLMRNAKLTKLAYGFNEYIFMHILLLRDNVESYLDRLPFEIKVEIINFISAKDFSKNIKDLPRVTDAMKISCSNQVKNCCFWNYLR